MVSAKLSLGDVPTYQISCSPSRPYPPLKAQFWYSTIRILHEELGCAETRELQTVIMSSPFQQHLGTNYVPSIHEIGDIRNIVEVTSKEVRAIDVEIHQLQQRLHLLQEKRSKVHDDLEQHRALLSSARRLTRDALEEIFLACLPSDRNPCMSATEAPMLLTQICSSWRSIAHSTPRLWAAIHVVLPPFKPEPFSSEALQSFQRNLIQRKLDRCRAVVKSWLDRSHECPLSLSLKGIPCPGLVNVDIVEHQEEMLQLYPPFVASILVPYSRHWFCIDICITSHLLNYLLKNGLTGLEHMSMLKELHISVRYPGLSLDSNANTVAWKDIIGLLSSKLICVTICGLITIDASDSSQIPKLSWGHLTELNLNTSGQIAKFAFDVIRHCLLLRTLKLSISSAVVPAPYESDGSWICGVGTVVLPCLTILSLSTTRGLETLELVKYLRLPSLQQLDFQFYCSYRDDLVFQQILEMLFSSCDLQSLGLYIGYPLESMGDAIPHLLQLTPNLKSLRFLTQLNHERWPSFIWRSTLDYKNVVNDNLLHALSPAEKDYSDIICPQLEVLECCSNAITSISKHALKEFVKARRRAHLLDQRVAALTIRVPVNEIKQKDTEEEIVPLSEGSVVYFRKGKSIDFSPWEGLNIHNDELEVPSEFSYEIHTEL